MARELTGIRTQPIQVVNAIALFSTVICIQLTVGGSVCPNGMLELLPDARDKVDQSLQILMPHYTGKHSVQ